MTRGWDLTEARNLGARPELFTGLRADLTDYGTPGVQLRPARRRKRGALTADEQAAGVMEIPPAAGAGAGGSPRLWPFLARNSAGTGRSTVVSPFYTGLGYIDRLLIRHASGGLVPDPQISILYSEDDAGAGVNLTPTVLPSGTSIFDTNSRQDESGGTNTISQGVYLVLHAADGLLHEWVFGYKVRVPRFTVKVSVHVNNAGSDVSVFGYIRLVEGLTPAELDALP